jgi:hypothetical protein
MPGASSYVTEAQEFRSQAAQARWLAARALKERDRVFWLRLADEWHQLAVQAELKHVSPTTLQSVKRRAMMDHLLQVEHHVVQGQRHVERQREIVARLEQIESEEAGRARELLAQFEQMQAMHIADRDRLCNELERSGTA